MATFNNLLNQRSMFRLINGLAPFAAVAALLSFIAVTWFGVGKVESTWLEDFSWYFASGKCFFAGSDMYDIKCMQPLLDEFHGYKLLAGLSYPPHFAPLTLLVALFPFFYAKMIYFVASVLASLGMVVIVSKTANDVQQQKGTEVPLSHKWALLLVMGSSGLWATIWLGQITIFVAVCLWVAFRQIRLGNELAAAILLALASVKPQIAALVFLWLLLNGQFRILVLSALTAGLLSIYIFADMGIVPALEGWLKNMSAYQDYPVNQLGNASVMGIPSFLALLGVNLPIWTGLGIGALVLIALRLKSSIDPFSPMALSTVLLVQMVIFSRPPDLILIAPAFALFWPTDRSHAIKFLLFLFAMAFYCFPQQLVIKVFSSPEAGHFRTLLLVGLLFAFVRQMLRGLERFDDKTPDQPIAIVQTA